jgi:hypothetical protein
VEMMEAGLTGASLMVRGPETGAAMLRGDYYHKPPLSRHSAHSESRVPIAL